MTSRSWQEAAAASLPPDLVDFFAGGSGAEQTLQDNERAWARLRLLPHVLRDVARIDTTTSVLGAPVALPVLVAPVAYQGLLHSQGEAATAEGAARAGSLMVVSTRASVPLEQVAAAAGPWWLQTYVLRDRSITEDLVRRGADAGCRALVLTGDTPLVASKPRDSSNGFAPPVLPAPITAGGSAQDPSIDLRTIEWLAGLAGLPVLVKGVLRPDDALACLEAGASGIVVSNHGGRQLDGALATADALAPVLEAVAGRAEVYVDGGIRTGTDVLKALALGARAVLLGRPVVWALACGGATGVEELLGGLRAELAEVMALAGARHLGALTPDLVVRP